jgi:hypothetical protein
MSSNNYRRGGQVTLLSGSVLESLLDKKWVRGYLYRHAATSTTVMLRMLSPSGACCAPISRKQRLPKLRQTNLVNTLAGARPRRGDLV